MPSEWGPTSFVGSIAMSMAYAHVIAQSEDRYVDIAERASKMLSGAMFPGAAMVNALPICACSLSDLVCALPEDAGM